MTALAYGNSANSLPQPWGLASPQSYTFWYEVTYLWMLHEEGVRANLSYRSVSAKAAHKPYLFKQSRLTRNMFFTNICCCSNCLRFYQQSHPKVGQKGCFALSIEENMPRILNLSICISMRERTAEGKEIIFYISISHKFKTFKNSCSGWKHSLNVL